MGAFCGDERCAVKGDEERALPRACAQSARRVGAIQSTRSLICGLRRSPGKQQEDMRPGKHAPGEPQLLSTNFPSAKYSGATNSSRSMCGRAAMQLCRQR